MKPITILLLIVILQNIVIMIALRTIGLEARDTNDVVRQNAEWIIPTADEYDAYMIVREQKLAK